MARPGRKPRPKREVQTRWTSTPLTDSLAANLASGASYPLLTGNHTYPVTALRKKERQIGNQLTGRRVIRVEIPVDKYDFYCSHLNVRLIRRTLGILLFLMSSVILDHLSFPFEKGGSSGTQEYCTRYNCLGKTACVALRLKDRHLQTTPMEYILEYDYGCRDCTIPAKNQYVTVC